MNTLTETQAAGLTPRVREILSGYDGESAGTRTRIARLLMHGRLGGTGRLLILPVDQGFEHGPDRSFGPNPPAYDPTYLFELAIEAGLSALAAPLGLLKAGAARYAGAVPLILKLNSANSLHPGGDDQAVTASIKDALDLGCEAIGFTLYPGSAHQYEMIEELRALARQAKAHGLAVVVWAYPRGGDLTGEDETALDVVTYAAHMACLLGADIVKVKVPEPHVRSEAAREAYLAMGLDLDSRRARIAQVMKSCFDSRRLVLFSGGAATDSASIHDTVRDIRDGGGTGSIIGRNTFQRPRAEALEMLDKIIAVYRDES